MGNKEITLQKVTKDDCEDIKNLMVMVYQDEKEKWFQDGGNLYIPGYHSAEMQLYHTWDNQYYKIVADQALAGVILVSCTGREHARIDRFYVLPEYQGMGIGSKALDMLEELYPKVSEWTLDTTQRSPRNHHFYEKNGYQLAGEDEDERYYCKTIEHEFGSEDLCSQDVSGRNVRDCNLSNLDFYDCNMSHSNFSNLNLCNNVYQNSAITENRFTDVNLSNSVFADSHMDQVEICFVSLTDAHFHDINLDVSKDQCHALLERCELCNSKIIDSNLSNVSIEHCKVDGMTIDGIKVEELLRVYREKNR